MATFRLQAKVTDPQGQVAQFDQTVTVDNVPVIRGVTVNPNPVRQGQSTQVTIDAFDPEGGALTYELVALDGGTVQQNPTNPAQFTFTPA